MGGNALKNNLSKNNVIRVNKNNYFNIENDIINNILPKTSLSKYIYKVASPRFIKNKESFGDLDLVVGVNNYHEINKLSNELKNILNFKFFEYLKNNSILSFSYPMQNDKVFQVDLIFVSLDNFESSLNYLSDNDFSNFIGRILKPFNLKISPKGLEFRFIYNNNEIKKNSILLTSDWNEILEIIGLDSKKWKNGFNNENEMFDYIVQSKFFDHTLYPLENLNHINRMRDKKRKNYHLFLKYLKDNNITKKVNKEKYQSIGIELLKKYNKYDIYLNRLKKIDEIEIFKKYFNGNVLKEEFKVEGKELGLLIQTLKKKHGKFLKEKALELDKDNNLIQEEKNLIFNIILENFGTKYLKIINNKN